METQKIETIKCPHCYKPIQLLRVEPLGLRPELVDYIERVIHEPLPNEKLPIQIFYRERANFALLQDALENIRKHMEALYDVIDGRITYAGDPRDEYGRAHRMALQKLHLSQLRKDSESLFKYAASIKTNQ